MISPQLNLSTRSAASDKAPDLRPKALKAWLGELPMGHAIQSGQQILERLREINQSLVKAATRHAALELLHPVVYKLCATLQRSHRDASFPLPAGHCLMTTLCQQLLEEMANGYKQVITDRLLDDSTTASLEALTQTQVDKVLLLSLWRAVNYLSAQLLECYLIYAPDPEGAWQDLHRLYHFAEQHLLHIYAVDVAPDDPPDPATLVECYKRSLLLSLCNPYHLMPDEVGTLFHQLSGWSAAVKLSRVAGSQTLAGHFVVDLDSDAPPRYAPPSKPVTAPAHGRLIDVSALLRHLDEHLQQLRATLKDKQYRQQPCLTERRDYDLYARLKHSWEMRQDRRFARNAQPNNIMMVTGLSACHHFISAMAAFAPEEDERALREFGEVEDDDSPAPRPPVARAAQSEGDVWERVYAKGPDPAAQRHSAARDAVQFPANPWQQRNTGRGGLAVYCVNDCRASVRVGELVTYKHNPAASSEHWNVGVIRWLRAPDFTSVELGIMALTDQAQAVATRALRGTGGGGDYARSLLVRHGDNATPEDTLITPPTIYDEGTLLLVNLGNRLLHVKLVELLEATRTFARFRYTTV
jgi:cyclic-di-GMP-binding protein